MAATKKARIDIAYDAPQTGPPKTLYDKIFADHTVLEANGASLIYIDRHLVHEVTSPQAFDGLSVAGRQVRRPDCTLVTVDHNVPTTSRQGFDMTDMKTNNFIKEAESQLQVLTLEQNVKRFGLTYYGMNDSRQGIVHVIGPEQGFTLPGTTVVCGDSHTSTHGAFGALAFGIGTSEVEHVLASQTLNLKKAKNLKINISGKIAAGISSKDMMLHIIGTIGAAGGTGCVIEFCGDAIEALSMEARMSMCNMAIEAGARAGMVAPDETTFAYIKGRPMAPTGTTWDRAVAYWKSLRSDAGAKYDTEVNIDGADIFPTVTWGTSPQDIAPITGCVPDPAKETNANRKSAMTRSLEYMGLTANTPINEINIDKVFIGSCTNSRIEDLRAAAAVANGRKVAPNVKLAMVVPGSGVVRDQAVAEGLDKVFREAGFDWREPGCSMCLAMNPDKLQPGERCASTSNRNFEGRQGKGGRTHLVSPAMAAAAAVTGHFVDVRTLVVESGSLEKTTGKIAIDSKTFLPEDTSATAVAEEQHATVTPGGAPERGFTTLTGKCAAYDKQNVDTDQIIPAKFLKVVTRKGLGKSAFYEARYNADGSKNMSFVLNQEPYTTASILVCGNNFGCGSSREHAPWALLDMGIQCLISTEFADIFLSNCYKNFMLPITLPRDVVETLMEDAENKLELTVDLATQLITRSSGATISFDVPEFQKRCLLEGLDEIALTLNKVTDISAFEETRTTRYPWLDGKGYKK
eukprot:m.143764 g.143764  ORF g.143764 m.143764 type:complete len:746 (-) comp30333_c1_seq3:372-2609(-)